MSHSAKRKCIRPPTITTILDLNDDVLCETFRHLNGSDLCFVANVCSTFKRNAQAEFALWHKKLRFSSKHGINKNYYTKNELHLRHLAPALRNFGPSLVSIWIDLHEGLGNRSQQVVKLLTRYCGESLNELHLVCMILTADLAQQLRPFLSRLQVLKLRYCYWTSEIFSFCTQLHTLSLVESTFYAAAKLPKLNSLFVRGDGLNDHSIEYLLAPNPQLKEIDIEDSSYVTVRIIPLIAKYTPQIEKIKFITCREYSIGFVENAKHLKRLTALKSLDIGPLPTDPFGNSFTCILNELTAAQITLVCLKLCDFRMDQKFINEITKWKHLKQLGLMQFSPFNLSDILMIVWNLSDLPELTLWGRYPLKEYLSINDLVEIVRRAPKLRKLVCFADDAIDENMLIKVRDEVAKREEKCPLVLDLHGGFRTFTIE